VGVIRFLRSLFAWREVRTAGAHAYLENAVTGRRKAVRVVTGGWSPVDQAWLDGGGEGRLLDRIRAASARLRARGIAPTRLELSEAEEARVWTEWYALGRGVLVRPEPARLLSRISRPLHGYSCVAGRRVAGKYEVVGYEREPLS
jgi:hypothetical protein